MSRCVALAINGSNQAVGIAQNAVTLAGERYGADCRDQAASQRAAQLGYRRVWGLLRREHETQSLAPVNVKQIYRVMCDHNLLLGRRIKQPGVPRRHEGRIAVATSDTR